MLKQALLELEIDPHKVVIVYGVGCSGNGSNFTEVYSFHGLHGRALPVAQGIKFVNKDMKVIVMGGDGDGMGLGVGHFIHAARRNVDLTYILHDNQIYGLTTGQASPRSDRGFVTKTSPEGTIEDPVNPISLALTANATFVARGFSGSPHHLKDMFKKAILHKGFSFVDVLQPCITFNKHNTYAWYNQRVYDLGEVEEYSTATKFAAWERANEWGEKIPMGVFYTEQKPTYEDLMALKEIPIKKELDDSIDIKSALKEFKI
jgi:2-oxoglutarate ferredoxin oxidoreductase subunit beta